MVDVVVVDVVAIAVEPHVPTCIVVIVDVCLVMGLLHVLDDSIAEIEPELSISYLQQCAPAQPHRIMPI